MKRPGVSAGPREKPEKTAPQKLTSAVRVNRRGEAHDVGVPKSGFGLLVPCGLIDVEVDVPSTYGSVYWSRFTFKTVCVLKRFWTRAIAPVSKAT